MMIPSNRLIGIAALITTPGLTLVSLGGPWMRYGLLLACTSVGIALLDWVLSMDLLEALRIGVESPVHAIVGRPFEFELTLHWNRPPSADVMLDFDAPEALTGLNVSRHWQLVTQKNGDGDPGTQHPQRKTLVQSLALRRGRHPIDHVNAQCDSRLGLWWLRRRVPVDVCIHCYPDLRGDRRLLATQEQIPELNE